MAIRAAWLLVIAILPIGLLHLVHMIDQPNTRVDEYRVDQMRFVESHADEPPITADWQIIQRGERISASIDRAQFNSSWVALDLPYRETSGKRLAVYIPMAEANVAVFHGNVFLGSSGEMKRPLPYYRRPLYFQLPTASEDDERTEPVYVRFARERNYSSPNEIFVGAAQALRAEYQRQRAYTLWIPAVAATLMLGFALILATLYILNKQEFAYGLFSIIIVLWATHTVHSLIDSIPFEHWAWFAIPPLCFWWVILTPVFINRFLELRVRNLATALVASGVVLMLPIFYLLKSFQIPTLYSYYANVWIPFVLICGFVAIIQCGYASWSRRTYETIGLYFLSVAGFVFGTRDYLRFFYDWIPGTNYYIRYVGMAQVLYFSLLIERRYTKSGRELAELNRNLEQRIEEKATEIEEMYEEQRELEREKTLAIERQRLMRDMHDGLGGQLIRALTISEKGQAPKEIREAIARALVDLRLIVDSIAPQHNDLISLLASFRYRSDRLWNSSGVSVTWDMADVPTTPLSPERSLHVLRIVQEAMTNALRHGDARNIRIMATTQNGKRCVDIKDDGVGFDTSSVSGGFGLSNMHRRATEANLMLRIESDCDGTRVHLCIPAESAGSNAGSLPG